MHTLRFERLSLSGDSHWHDLVCKTKRDAELIHDYIQEHGENIGDMIVEPYLLPQAQTFESWKAWFERGR